MNSIEDLKPGDIIDAVRIPDIIGQGTRPWSVTACPCMLANPPVPARSCGHQWQVVEFSSNIVVKRYRADEFHIVELLDAMSIPHTSDVEREYLRRLGKLEKYKLVACFEGSYLLPMALEREAAEAIQHEWETLRAAQAPRALVSSDELSQGLFEVPRRSSS